MAQAVKRRYLSMSEFAEYWGCNERTVRRMIADGKLKAVRLGDRMIRIDIEALENAGRPVGVSEDL